MVFVLFSILMDVVGFGIIVPILPFYVQSLGGGPEVVTLCLALHTASMFLSSQSSSLRKSLYFLAFG